MKRTTIDASSLNQDTWYPVSIYVPPSENIRIEVEVALDSGTTPSWSTHSSGFSVRKIWETNGAGWGTIPITRNIYVSTYSFASVDPVRGLDQNTMASVEIVYVRGGGKYFFKTSPEAGTPTLNSGGYSWSSGSHSYSAPITTTAPAAIYAYASITVPQANNATTATKLATARTISLTGSITGSGSFDGSGNLSIATTTNHNHDSSYVKKSGDTMSGPLTFANGTCNVVGDDCGMGDINSVGTLAFQGKNGTTNLWLVQYGATWSASANHATISYDGTKVSCDKPFYGAVWNDYAEFRSCNEDFKPGQVVLENGDDTLSIASKRLQRGCSIVSDTFGFAIGETDEAKCPIAVSGRVLAYGYESREEFKKNIGRPVCSGPNGTVSIMTDEEYRNKGYCAIGTISAVPDYEEWGTGKVKVNGRVWIKVF